MQFPVKGRAALLIHSLLIPGSNTNLKERDAVWIGGHTDDPTHTGGELAYLAQFGAASLSARLY